MILFFVSLILTLFTGYFITSVFEQKNFIKIFIYFCLTMFASIVLNVEILSLFSKISESGIITLNLLFAIAAGYVWYKKGKPTFKILYKRFFKRIWYAVLSDKYLLVLGISFLFMLGVSLFLIATQPIVNPDAEAYHVLRSLFWIHNGNLNHFAIADTRALAMPINSEILYLWLLIFLKKQLWFGIFSFTGFLLSITSLYGILGKLHISERPKLWTIFLLSSFPSVIIQLSGTETDIIISGLVLSSIYLYWNSLKTNNKSELYFAALSYALAIGTKAPSLMLMFPIGIWMLWMGYKHMQKDFYKPFCKFILFGIINFILFGAYNYVLNFINYGSIFGPLYFQMIHKNLYGIRGMFAGFIKHIFMFFDFTGFTWNQTLGPHILAIKDNLLHIFSLDDVSNGLLCTKGNKFNNTLLEPLTGLGVLGFIIYLPCWIYSMVIMPFKQKESNKIIGSFGLILLGAILVMSYKITFMTFNIRFLTSFCIVSAPILVYSYIRKNNIPKFIFTAFMLFGLLVISTHLWARPFMRIMNYMKHGTTIQQIREYQNCSILPKKYIKNLPIRNEICKVEKSIKEFDKNKKILYILNRSESILKIKMLDFEGYNIDYALLYDADKIDFNKYDILITLEDMQIAYNNKNNTTSKQFYPIDGIFCEDIPVSEQTKLPDRENILHLTNCYIDNKFYRNNNFTLKKVIPFINDENIKIEYKIYEKSN